MANIELPQDFREFLRLLAVHDVEHLLVGAYAVAYHGYPRATQDLDVWVDVDEDNAGRLVTVLAEFGFADDERVTPELFLEAGRIVRMGRPPMRLELLTELTALEFEEARARADRLDLDDVTVPVISLEDLKANKRAVGRPRDLDDLENLP